MRNFKYLLLITFSLLLLGSCQEDEKPIDNSSKIIGHWKFDINYGDTIQVTNYYSFLENGLYNSSTAYTNSDSGEILGFTRRSSGTYSLLDNELSAQSTIVFAKPESSESIYLPNEELVQVDNTFTISCKVDFSGDKRKMTWIYPPCGELQDCIGSQELKRYTPIEF